LGIGFSWDNAGLVSPVNGAPAGMKADGGYHALAAHWDLA
jgi:hypothetical protein